MKKKGAVALGLLFFSMLGFAVLQSCDKDTYCHVDVTVVDQTNRQRVPNALVMIYVNGSTVGDTGYTNSDGVYNTKLAAPGVFNVKAQKQVSDCVGHDVSEWYCHRDGTASVRLKEGETVASTVYLTADVTHDRR